MSDHYPFRQSAYCKVYKESEKQPWKINNRNGLKSHAFVPRGHMCLHLDYVEFS